MGYAFEGRLALPGVKREGEGGADGEGAIELLALTYQRLTEVHALSGRQ